MRREFFERNVCAQVLAAIKFSFSLCALCETSASSARNCIIMPIQDDNETTRVERFLGAYNALDAHLQSVFAAREREGAVRASIVSFAD